MALDAGRADIQIEQEAAGLLEDFQKGTVK
jgi:hypothetical protein